MKLQADDLAKVASIIGQLVSKKNREKVPILVCARLNSVDDVLPRYGTDPEYWRF